MGLSQDTGPILNAEFKSKISNQIKSKKLCTNPNFYAALCLVIGRRLYFTMVKVSMAVLIYLCKNFFLEGGLILKF
jgi:hypothetical protein